uniref:Uncharacterized protein n=1 Tax=Arundo donax TaxID=35708 RepID=A0A0A9DWQ2_ARUDO
MNSPRYFHMLSCPISFFQFA